MSFQSDKPKDEYVRVKFSEISARYDLFNDIITLGLHRLWKKEVAKKALADNPKIILDACCGTGDIALLLRSNTGRDVKIFGVDFSQNMLELAHSKNCPNIEWLERDMMNSGFQSDEFDAVTIGFGLRNLKDHRGGVREIRRILKPTGRLVIMDMGKVKTPVIGPLIRFYFFRVVPLLGKILQPGQSMFDYFPKSTLDFPSAENLTLMLKEEGFNNVTVSKKIFGSVMILTAS